MTRQHLINYLHKTFSRMGLQTFKASLDYRGSRPDFITLYPQRGEYYLVDAVGTDEFEPPYRRLSRIDYDRNIRGYAKKSALNEKMATWTSVLFSDVAQGYELFQYTLLGTSNLKGMKKCAAIAYSEELADSAIEVFNKFNINYSTISLLNNTCLTMFPVAESLRLVEYRHFIQFLTANVGR